jgi:GTP-binding protein
MFVDHIKISAKAGDGGDGAVSFRREKFVPKGGPDGGDGGRGGSIIFRADANVDNLAGFFYEPIIKAKNGERGMGKQCYGKAAKDVIVPVPIGTIIARVPERLLPPPHDPLDFEERPKPQIMPEDLIPVADLARDGQELVLCKGGEGGKGNIHFKSSRNRAPRQYTPGGEGEEGTFYLELRKIADAGLVGYPNAGKSTILGKISAAHPKVAPYPFTTLHPMVGVVEFPGFQRATVADIPGLVEGAHRNVGLGHDFLRHIVRCKLLVHVIDMAGSEGRNPYEDLSNLRQELKLYDPALAARPWLVVANKMDLPGAAENLKVFKRRIRKVKVVPISALKSEGIAELKAVLGEQIAPAESTQ